MLKIKPPSVTGMLEKLEREGLLEWKKRIGVRLTDDGHALGRKILEVHRLLENFFTKVLGLDRNDDEEIKHRIACDLEHHLLEEPRLIEAIQRSIEKVS